VKFIVRSLIIILALYGLVFAVGDAYLSHAQAPPWLAVGFAVVFVGLQYAIGPSVIGWALSIYWCDLPENAGELPAVNRDFIDRLCASRGLPRPRLGLIQSGTPNAFSFGHAPADARIVVTTGLLDMLTPDEVNAVLAHELGHVEHWDFVVMTIAALVPLLLYQVYAFGRRVGHFRLVGEGAYLAYLVSQFVVLLLNRTREYYADAYSSHVTGHPEELASALVKIAIGLVQSDGNYRATPAASDLRRDHRLAGALALMGISNINSGRALILSGGDPASAARVMRWDFTNPWARIYELNSTHPLTAFRVRALGSDPDPATRPHDLAAAPMAPAGTNWAAFLLEVGLWAAPMVAATVLVFGGFVEGAMASTGLVVPGWAAPALLIFIGATWLARTAYRYRGEFQPAEIGSLLDDLRVSEMRPRAVRIEGEIVGRGVPGAFWSPDLVLRDRTGILFVLYRQSIPFARLLFALAAADDFIGRHVAINGWFRRGVRPYVELASITPDGSPTTRTYSRWVQYAAALVTIAVGWRWLVAR
jgi:heat shock protein HtpX